MAATAVPMDSLAETLRKKFPGAVLSVDVDTARSELTVHIAAPRIVEIARFLHDDPMACFDHLTDICSADYPDAPQRFEVIYQLLSLPRGKRIRLKARVHEDNPAIDSVTGIWRAAGFLEREVYDMMGIRFIGHPDLRRILLPDDYDEGHPLRKDFPTEGRGWRSQFDFIPRLDEPPTEHIEFSAEEKRLFLSDPDGSSGKRREELLLNMGPQHPSTHGVVRVVLELDGERIVKATPDMRWALTTSRRTPAGRAQAAPCSRMSAHPDSFHHSPIAYPSGKLWRCQARMTNSTPLCVSRRSVITSTDRTRARRSAPPACSTALASSARARRAWASVPVGAGSSPSSTLEGSRRNVRRQPSDAKM